MTGRKAFVLGAASASGAIFGLALYMHLKKEKRRDALANELGILVKAKLQAQLNLAMAESEIKAWAKNAADYMMWKGYKSMGEYPQLEAEIDKTIDKWKQSQGIETQKEGSREPPDEEKI